MNKFIKVIPLFQLWWGLSIGGASPAYLRRVGKIRLNLWKFLLFLSENITRIANAVQSLCLVGSLWLHWFPNLLCFHKHSRFKLGTFGEWVTHWVASMLDRESEGWLPEGENTLCFKSNAAAAAAASWTTQNWKTLIPAPWLSWEIQGVFFFTGPPLKVKVWKT